MGVIKYKDSDGQWKKLANAICSGGNLKSVVIQKSGQTSYDLSPYVPSGSTDFILFFTYGSPVTQGGYAMLFRYALIGGELTAPPYEDGISSTTGIDKLVGEDMDDTGMFFVDKDVNYEYDFDTCQLSLHNTGTNTYSYRVGTSALLLYLA